MSNNLKSEFIEKKSPRFVFAFITQILFFVQKKMKNRQMEVVIEIVFNKNQSLQ